MDEAQIIALTLRGGTARKEDPYLIRCPFDPNLEIAITNEQRLMGTEDPVYLWRPRKWYYDQKRESYRQVKYYTLRDLFLFEDLIKDTKAKMKPLYAPIFVPQEQTRRRLRRRIRDVPFMWDCDVSPVEAEEREDEQPKRAKYPWED